MQDLFAALILIGLTLAAVAAWVYIYLLHRQIQVLRMDMDFIKAVLKIENKKI